MTTTSKEYAVALLELSTEAGLIGETREGLETVVSALMQQPAYKAMLASPAIGKEQRIQALDEAFRGKVPEVLMGVLRMMVSRGHVSQVERMYRDFDRMARDAEGESIAQVTSAVPLREADTVLLRQRLEQLSGRRVTLQCAVDPGLIGGIRVEMDGKVIDGSIRIKLSQIKDVMNG